MKPRSSQSRWHRVPEFAQLDSRPHEVLDTPDNPLTRDTKLWRYMDLAKYLAMLESRAINFSRADHLGDPFEGSSTLLTSEAAKAVRYSDGRSAAEHTKQMREELSISCWNQSEVESDTLWGRYVTEGAGVAVQSTVGRIGDAFQGSGDSPTEHRTAIYASRIRYVDYATAHWPNDNVMWPFVHKRLQFDAEREVRLLAMWPPKQWMVDAQGAAEAAHPDKTNVVGAVPPSITPIARPIAADLRMLLEDVVISRNAPTWFMELVGNVGRRYGLNITPRRSSLAAEPIW